MIQRVLLGIDDLSSFLIDTESDDDGYCECRFMGLFLCTSK